VTVGKKKKKKGEEEKKNILSKNILHAPSESKAHAGRARALFSLCAHCEAYPGLSSSSLQPRLSLSLSLSPSLSLSLSLPLAHSSTGEGV